MSGAAVRNAVAKRLIQERIARGLERREFAVLLDVSPTTIRYWEDAIFLPGVRRYLKFINVLDLDLKKLIEENKNKTP